jgi:tetratricopeptide (TPR) repeat protein
MRKILQVIICFFCFTTAEAQVITASFYYKSGLQLTEQNKFPEAITAFNNAIKLNKKFDSAYVQAADLYSKSGNWDAAFFNYKKAISINPKFSNAFAGMGKFYRDSKQNLDSALYFYQMAASLDTTNKEAFYSIAWCFNAKKEYDSAISYAVKSLAIDNKYRPGYSELGHAYNASKKYVDAIVQFKKNLAISVVDVAYLYSGYCYLELNNKEGALEQYEALNKINEKMAAALKRKIDAFK